MLSDQSIEKYRAIYQKEFGIEIPKEDAAEQAQRLLNFARIVRQPMPKSWEPRYKQLLEEHLTEKPADKDEPNY